MKDYDIGEAFQRIEEEMIASMSRNLQRHLNTEEKEGLNYSMWQAEQLAALNEFKRNNSSLFSGYFSTINEQVGELLQKANDSGKMEQEAKILEAIREGWSTAKPGDHLQGAFFKINDRKMKALITATKKDLAKAEHAMLRQANDVYRKTIFNAETFYNSGAGTLQQCVDMATKDFLSKGITCVEYANGARVGIDSYSRMALRTAQTRAYLQGESTKRDEWGVNTVIVNKRGVACPKCLKWVGKVYYDDVYGSTPVKDDKYPRLSEAIAGGLYHPNCKDIHTTYFEGVSTKPKPMTQAQVDEANRVYALEQRQRYNERMIRKYKRLSEGSIDPENKAKYGAKLKEWQVEQDKYINKTGKDLFTSKHNYDIISKEVSANPEVNDFSPAATRQEAEAFISKYVDETAFGAVGVSYKGISVDVANEINRTISTLCEKFKADKFGGIIAPNGNTKLGQKISNALAGYSPARNSFLLNRQSFKDLRTAEKALRSEKEIFESLLAHPEDFNWDKMSKALKDAIERSKVSGRLTTAETIEEVITHEFGHFLERRIQSSNLWELVKRNMPQYMNSISGYAGTNISEYIAESFSSYMKGEDKIDPVLKKIFDGMGGAHIG